MGYINRDWGFEKWQCVVNELKEKILFIQTSLNDQRILNNVLNINNTIKLDTCSTCKLNDKCLGIPKGYASKFGEDEFKPIQSKKEGIDNIPKIIS